MNTPISPPTRPKVGRIASVIGALATLLLAAGAPTAASAVAASSPHAGAAPRVVSALPTPGPATVRFPTLTIASVSGYTVTVRVTGGDPATYADLSLGWENVAQPVLGGGTDSITPEMTVTTDREPGAWVFYLTARSTTGQWETSPEVSATLPATASAPAPAPPSFPVYRFYNPTSQSHFFTINEGERQGIIDRWSGSWRYEGVAFRAFVTQVPGTVPLYRFHSPRSSHFFTTSTGERDYLVANGGEWTYEGISFYVYPPTSTMPDTVPVARFWNSTNGRHFYTAVAVERDVLIRGWPGIWIYEGDEFKLPTR